MQTSLFFLQKMKKSSPFVFPLANLAINGYIRANLHDEIWQQ